MSDKTNATKKWEDDGIEGGQSSMDILLDWDELCQVEGRRGWRDKADSLRRDSRLKEAGIHHRNAADVRTKISSFQTSYNKARDWSENTGETARRKPSRV